MNDQKQFQKMNTWILFIKIALVFLSLFLVAFLIELSSININFELLEIWFHLSFHSIVILLLLRSFKKYNIRAKYVFGNLSIGEESWLSLIGIKVLLLVFSLLAVISLISVAGFIDPNIYKQITEEPSASIYGESYVFSTFLISLTIGPMMEELLFRGYLFSKWGERIGVTKAMIFSSLLFAFIHFNSGFISHFVSGLFFTMVYLKTNKLILPILLHSFHNLIVGITFFILPETEPVIEGEWLVEIIQELQFVLNILTLLFILLIPFVWYVLYRYFKNASTAIPYYVNQNRNT